MASASGPVADEWRERARHRAQARRPRWRHAALADGTVKESPDGGRPWTDRLAAGGDR
jgi:hypothetical protein